MADQENPPSTALGPDYISLTGSTPGSSFDVKTEEVDNHEQSTSASNSAQTDSGHESSPSATTGESNEKPPVQALLHEPQLKLIDWESVRSETMKIKERYFLPAPDESVGWEEYRKDLRTLLDQDFFKLDRPLNIRNVFKDGAKDLHRKFVGEFLERKKMLTPRAPLIDALCGFSEGPVDVDFWEVSFLCGLGEAVDAGRYKQVEKYFEETLEALDDVDVQLHAWL